ncbi:MAG: dephospho-CoA kinase [bacterium]
MLVVGLTGGIAAGKSTVLEMFKELGSKTVDADVIAHKVLAPKTEVWKKLIDYFGRRVLDKDLNIQRDKIADIVFEDYKELNVLNQITHPPIIKEIKAKIDEYIKDSKDKEEIVIVDAPLLFESYIAPLMDQIIVITIPAGTQMQRLIRRSGLDYSKAKIRVQAQMPQNDKTQYANYIINGKDKPAKIKEEVKNIWQELRAQSAKTQVPKISKIYF